MAASRLFWRLEKVSAGKRFATHFTTPLDASRNTITVTAPQPPPKVLYNAKAIRSQRNLSIPKIHPRDMTVSSEDQFVGAIDQGTSSTRFLIFNLKTQQIVASKQIEITQNFPKEGWVEECPDEILESCLRCIDATASIFAELGLEPEQLKCIGITNQRETTIVWDPRTGKALHNAIVWCDSRASETVEKLIASAPGGKDALREKCGLPIAQYFSALKIRWLMDNYPDIADKLKNGDALVGTVDSWLVWKMTGQHVTDVTNASRTMLFNINTLSWDQELCDFFGIPLNCLPVSARLLRNTAHLPSRNTYGTGCFLLQNTGEKPVQSECGLLTTVAYQLGKDAPAHFALEGSIAAAGSVIRWLRDNLGLIKTSSDAEALASQVPDSGSFVFVPAFNGLFAPRWRPDARGTMTGITQFTTKQHIVYGALESCCFQTRDLFDAIAQESGSMPLSMLRVDGGMTSNKLLLQRQADLLQVPVERPQMSETTALGAALAAAVGSGFLNKDDISNLSPVERFDPVLGEKDAARRMHLWHCAVEKSLNSV
ncbi:Oidioi.mRNA.OKI2018_I69.PAR.g12716.t1.cds [Oikopleura dioica]|uniref:glycerol kinase n=1 Tax=Oikopleura dioica TaxID=34765 RepID=A0ABN7S5X1_OIKDI|nr:Oidioi.mRNA.OKI2018_I69.PAR.g12716.t1.cds [Oikopleura dioica]